MNDTQVIGGFILVAILTFLAFKYLGERNISRIIDKILSGRYMVTLLMAVTYCYLVSFIITKLSDKVSADFALGFVGGFSTSFMLVIQWYFDEKNNVNGRNENENKDKNVSVGRGASVVSDVSASPTGPSGGSAGGPTDGGGSANPGA